MKYQWERDAANGAEVPKELTLEEQLAFIALKNLHRAFRANAVSREQATSEKNMIFSLCGRVQSERDLWGRTLEQHARIWKEMGAPAAKVRESGDPEAAKKILEILYGG